MNDLNDLMQALDNLQATARDAELQIETVRKILVDSADELTIALRTHENWPELCKCGDCEEIRERIAQIRASVVR